MQLIRSRRAFPLMVAALVGAAALALLIALSGSAHSSTANAAVKGHPTAQLSTPTTAKSKVTGTETDSIQSGDQSTQDPSATAESSSETSGENSGESSSASDGPGGHQDSAGQNVDHQFSGQE